MYMVTPSSPQNIKWLMPYLNNCTIAGVFPEMGAEEKCGFCRLGREVEADCGTLHVSGPIAAHHKCMVSGIRGLVFRHFLTGTDIIFRGPVTH